MKNLFKVLFFLLIVHFAINVDNSKAQWQPDVRLTNDPSGSYTSNNNAWCVAASGSVVHVVWYDNRNGINNGEIYYKRSSDAGVSWGADIRLTNNTANSEFPSVAVSGSVVHVVWNDYRNGDDEIYYKRSTDAGITWGIDTRLTNNLSASMNPSVAVSGTAVHVVWCDWRDEGASEIYYIRSIDAGINWGEETRLTNDIAFSQFSSVTVSGSVVYVVWRDDRDGNYEIYYKRSTDAGVSWGADTRLTYNTASSWSPTVAVSGTVVLVVWFDNRYANYEIYYNRSTDAGVSWGTDTRLTNNYADKWYPSVTISDSVVHVVWQDRRDDNWEIYYKSSTNTGISWVAETRLTNDTAYSSFPSIAVSGSAVHVVWMDKRDGNGGEIYYKRNPTGNPVNIQNISTEIPSGFSLRQNYPNPFNPNTNIKFDIAKLSDVKIVVYDVMGREVETLVNESLKPGTYEASFDGSELTSGVYFYKISAGEFSETKKMLLVK